MKRSLYFVVSLACMISFSNLGKANANGPLFYVPQNTGIIHIPTDCKADSGGMGPCITVMAVNLRTGEALVVHDIPGVVPDRTRELLLDYGSKFGDFSSMYLIAVGGGLKSSARRSYNGPIIEARRKLIEILDEFEILRTKRTIRWLPSDSTGALEFNFQGEQEVVLGVFLDQKGKIVRKKVEDWPTISSCSHQLSRSAVH